jgi:hyaluronan synthase
MKSKVISSLDDAYSRVLVRLQRLRQPGLIQQQSGQRIDADGRIVVSRKGWLVRIITLSAMILIAAFNLYQGIIFSDMLVVYATLVLAHSILILAVGWFLYRNPARVEAGNELASVIIPVYNQKGMIERVIEAIYRSSYQNIEVVAVNDGSKDGTKEILDELAKKYPTLRVIHKPNQGKRRAVATGFKESKGSFVVLIDSDSIIEETAIEELMKAFNSDPSVGGVVGQAKVWNANKNVLTKCQDAWYDYAFNMYKVCESRFGSVTCCSGCLAGYRRESIEEFIPHWAESPIQYSDDRALTSFAIGSKRFKLESSTIAGKLGMHAASYDDAEDRMLTVQSLTEWKTVYVASAIVYTDVPENVKGYLKQQQRWKKGYIRSNFFASVFFWRKHPIMSLIFYTDFMATFTLPLIIFTVLIYEPFVLGEIFTPLVYLFGLSMVGFAQGLDYRFRDPTAKNWKYKPLMNLMSTFLLSWLLFPSLLTLRKNQWLTR